MSALTIEARGFDSLLVYTLSLWPGIWNSALPQKSLAFKRNGQREIYINRVGKQRKHRSICSLFSRILLFFFFFHILPSPSFKALTVKSHKSVHLKHVLSQKSQSIIQEFIFTQEILIQTRKCQKVEIHKELECSFSESGWWEYILFYYTVWSVFSSVQSLSCVRLFATPWTAAHQASLSITNSQSLPKLMSIESMMPSNHLILCCPILLPSIFPNIRVFSYETALCIRWPKYWSFSFNISPFNELPELIFRMDWLDLLAVQGTLKSLLQHHSSKASILQCSAFFTVQLSHPYMTGWKTSHTYWKNHSLD